MRSSRVFVLLLITLQLAIPLLAQRGTVGTSDENDKDETTRDIVVDRLRESLKNSNESLPNRLVRREIDFEQNATAGTVSWRISRYVLNRVTNTVTINYKYFSFQVSPVPRVLVRKFGTSFPQGQQDEATRTGTVEFGYALTGILEFTENNRRPGFQFGSNDTRVNFTSLVAPRRAWGMPWVSRQRDQRTGNIVARYTICRQDDLLCLSFVTANGTYIRNGTLAYPDELKLDINIFPNLLVPSNPRNFIAVAARLMTKGSYSKVTDNTDDNDERIRDAETRGNERVEAKNDMEVESTDVSDNERGFVNFERKLIVSRYNLTSESIERNLVRVVATPVPAAFDDRANNTRVRTVGEDAIYGYFDVSRLVLYTIMSPLTPLTRSFYWDPSFGVDAPVSSLNVDSGSNSGTTGGSNSGPSSSSGNANNLNGNLQIIRNRTNEVGDSNVTITRTVFIRPSIFAPRLRINRIVRGTNFRSLDTLLFELRISPFIRVLVRKLSATSSENDEVTAVTASRLSLMMSLTGLVEYNETNGQPGFQPGQDQAILFSTMRADRSEWGSWELTNYTVRNGNVRVFQAQICTDGVSRTFDICLTAKIANGTYLHSNRTFAPDAVKIDLDIIGYTPQNTGNYLALVSRSFFSVSGAVVKDTENFGSVDSYLDTLSNTTTATRNMANDLVYQQNGDQESILVNWARTLTAVRTNGAKQIVRVRTTAVNNLQNDNFDRTSNVLQQADGAYAYFTNQKIYIYSFLLPLDNDIERFSWDPEFAVDVEGSSSPLTQQNQNGTETGNGDRGNGAVSSWSTSLPILFTTVLILIASLALF
jgi:hypothetical protein